MKIVSSVIGFFKNGYKPLLIGAVIVALFFVIKDYKFSKSEVARLTENEQEFFKEKENIITSYQATSEEFANFLNKIAPEIIERLDSVDIKIKNIEQVSIQEITYIDTVKRKTDLNPILEAIKKNGETTVIKPVSLPVVDETPCLLVRGVVSFNGQSLELDITDRKFTSINEVVTHIERNQWKLLGLIPTRLFGKKEVKVTVLNGCGESVTTILTKSKGKWQRKK